MSTVLTRWTGRLATRRRLRDHAEAHVTYWRKRYHEAKPGTADRKRAFVMLKAREAKLRFREAQVRRAERAVARHRHDQFPAHASRGIDVSNHQGTVNFDLVAKAGFEFVYIKATEGTTFKDQFFLANVTRAKAAGLKVGAYHFLHHGSADAQAAVFVARLRLAGLDKGDLMPMVDVETETGQPNPNLSDVSQFVQGVTRRLGVRCGIYTFPSFMRWPTTLGCPLWIANFNVKAPTIPAPWTKYAIWQHSSTATVPGVNGNCDVNVCPDLERVIA